MTNAAPFPEAPGRAVQSSPEPIDVVYTWVDDADPAWRRRMERARREEVRAPAAVDTRSNRYRTCDELRYSLRSLDRFAPWVRQVFVVSAGQRPAWLPEATPRLTFVPHEAIFPDPACLPTFNSNAIELNLHRIPGLSRRFLYLNDDVFFGRPSASTYFVRGEDGFLDFHRIHLHRDLSPDDVGDRACARTLEAVTARLGGPPLAWMPAHGPQLYDSRVLDELEARFPDAFARTRRSRFRSDEDFVLRIGYAALAVRHGHTQRMLEWCSEDYAFLLLEVPLLRRLRDFVAVGRRRPRVFCVNDDRPPGWRGWTLAAMMRLFLRLYFPQASSFERPIAPG